MQLRLFSLNTCEYQSSCLSTSSLHPSNATEADSIPRFDALGVGGGGSLIGGMAALLAPVPFLFYWKGEAIRRRSRFAPTDGGPHEKHEKPDEGEQQERQGNGDNERQDASQAELTSPSTGSEVSSIKSAEVDAGREGARTDDAELRTATGEVIESEKDLERHQRQHKET